MFDYQAFVSWFRESSPYIHAHRGCTFVVCFGGEVVQDSGFVSLVQDFALLNSLGIRLVLVHGIRPQIEQRLSQRNIESRYAKGLRITDSVALQCVKDAAGMVRVEIEALMSMGVANSPMAGARIRIASGNFVTAKPLGIIDGIDFGYTGEVRRIDDQAIIEKLEQKNVVMLSPIGYSITGEVFNLSAEMLATSVATAVKADKLILLMEQDCINVKDAEKIHQLTTDQAQDIVDQQTALFPEIKQQLAAAIKACQTGVKRVHLVSRKTEGALLLELFTRDGIGTLVSSTPFERLRTASINDVGGILDLIRPLERSGVLVARSRENLEMEIESFAVLERDGLILGCAALHTFSSQKMAELACLALHPDYHGEMRGERLLSHVESEAKALGLKKLFVLTTQTSHWFMEREFENSSIHQLPVERQSLYNYQRNSKVLVKNLSA